MMFVKAGERSMYWANEVNMCAGCCNEPELVLCTSRGAGGAGRRTHVEEDERRDEVEGVGRQERDDDVPADVGRREVSVGSQVLLHGRLSHRSSEC